MSQSVACLTMFGEEIFVEREKISFRPSAYGLVLHEGKILLSLTRSTGKWSIPGGGVDIGERLEEALVREIREECGIESTVLKPLFFDERFFYYQPLDRAWQCHCFFFLVRPDSFSLSDAENEPGDEAMQPRWVDIGSLKAEDFQISGESIVEALRQIQSA